MPDRPLTDAEKEVLREAVANRRPIGHLLGRPDALATMATSAKRTDPCVHLGPPVDTVECESCAGRVLLKVFGCAVHGKCLRRASKSLPHLAACRCEAYQPLRGDDP